MIFNILDIALAGFDAYIILSIYNRIFMRKSARRWIVVAAVICVAYRVVTQHLTLNGTATAIFSAVLCVAMTFPFHAKWKQRLFYSIILITIEIAAEIIAGYTLSITSGMEVSEIAFQAKLFGTTYLMGATLSKLIFLLLARITCRLKEVKDSSINNFHWVIVILVPIASIVIQYGLANTSTQYSMTNYTAPFLMLVGILAINILTFSVYDLMSSQSESLIELERAKTHMSYEIRHYETIAAHSKYLSARTHDIRSHMIALQGLLAEKKIEEAEQYISEIAIPEFVSQPALVPGHPAISAVLGDRIARAEKHGIVVAQKISLLFDAPLIESDFCIILGNALDNAIEACDGLSDDKAKVITLDMRSADNKFTFRIANTSPPVEIINGACRTTKNNKELHGFGLNSIRHIVEAAGGNMVIQFENGLFELHIILFVQSA